LSPLFLDYSSALFQRLAFALGQIRTSNNTWLMIAES
jgi:hypothetical protein